MPVTNLNFKEMKDLKLITQIGITFVDRALNGRPSTQNNEVYLDHIVCYISTIKYRLVNIESFRRVIQSDSLYKLCINVLVETVVVASMKVMKVQQSTHQNHKINKFS